MKITNINNNQMNFKRVIRINSISNPDFPVSARRVDDSTFEIATVLNSNKSKVYSETESKQLKRFFMDILGDYDGRSGILMKRVDGDVIILSGQDAADIKKLEAEQVKKRQKYTESDKYSNKEKKMLKQNTFLTINKEIKSRLENGTYNKPNTSLVFSSSTLSPQDITTEQIFGKEKIDTKIDTIAYACMQTYQIPEKDGHAIYSKQSIPKQPYRTYENYIYEQKELNLNQ